MTTQNQTFLWIYDEPEISEIVELVNNGYSVIVIDNDEMDEMLKELGNLPELQGKLVSIDVE